MNYEYPEPDLVVRHCSQCGVLFGSNYQPITVPKVLCDDCRLGLKRVDPFVASYTETLVLAAIFPEKYDQWGDLSWDKLTQCNRCGHVGVTVFRTERSSGIEEHRVGCNGCSIVGDETSDMFRRITTFNEWMELEDKKTPR